VSRFIDEANRLQSMIWEYPDTAKRVADAVAESFHVSIHGLGFGRHGECPFCKEELQLVPQNRAAYRSLRRHIKASADNQYL
jgi:hypothetical protein